MRPGAMEERQLLLRNLLKEKGGGGKYQAFSPLSLPSGDWNVKVGIQVIPGVTGKFGLGVQMKQGKG